MPVFHMCKLIKSLLTSCAIFLLSLATQANAVVLIESEGIQVTSEDLIAEVRRSPQANESANKNILANNAQATQLALNLYSRRILAQQFADKAANKDIAMAEAQLAADRVLSEKHLQQLDEANKPSESTLEKLAQTVYRAEPKRFTLPEAVRVRQIFILKSIPDAKAKIDAIMAQLKSGADFAALASERSRDFSTANDGGDMGYLARGKTPPPFESAIFAMTKPGEIAGPVETQFGYHAVLLEDRRPSRLQSYEEVKPQIQQEILSKVITQYRNELDAKIKGNAVVKTEAIEQFTASQR